MVEVVGTMGDEETSPDTTSDYTNTLLLSLLAGMSTCLGAAVAFCCNTSGGKRTLRQSHLAFSLSLAGAVMVTVSIASILPEAFSSHRKDDTAILSPNTLEFWERCLAFSAGCLIYVLLSKCAFPEPEEILGFDDDPTSTSTTLTQPLIEPTLDREMSNDPTVHVRLGETRYLTARKPNIVVETSPPSHPEIMPTMSATSSHSAPPPPPHDQYSSKGAKYQSLEAQRNWRVAMLLFVSLAVHNFPEGLAVAASSLHSPHLGWTTTAAIALHNIPEGIAIAIPCLAARPDSPWLAFGLASVSGLAEPLGALVALTFLSSDAAAADDDSASRSSGTTSWNIENVLAFVAGIMIMVSVVELFPEARRNMRNNRWPGVFGVLTGVVVMLATDAYLVD